MLEGDPCNAIYFVVSGRIPDLTFYPYLAAS